MYCLDSFGSDIEHFYPKSVYPCLAFTWDNYLLACSYCNRIRKNDSFPLDDDNSPLLLNPATEDPNLHLSLIPSSGVLRGTTAKGRTTISTLDLNSTELVPGRTHRALPATRLKALQQVITALRCYNSLNAIDPKTAENLKTQLLEEPSLIYLRIVLRVAASPDASQLLAPDVIGILNGDVATWL